MSGRLVVAIACSATLWCCSASRGVATAPPELTLAAVDGSATTDGGHDAVPEGAPPATYPAGLCRPTSREPGAVPVEEGPTPSIRRVSIRVEPADGGMAHRDVEQDGRVNGGHLSGDMSAPMVSQEHGRVSAECVEAVWQVAARVVAATESATGPAPASDVGWTILRITVEGADAVEVRWPHRQEAPRADVRALVALLHEMEIGYW